jgi:hypothetical protein
MDKLRSKLERELVIRALAARNLDTFAAYAKPDFISGWFNNLLHNTVQQFVDDSLNKKSPRLIVTCPPRHGKTQAVTRSLAAFFAGYAPGMSAIFATHTASVAGDNGSDIQAIVDSDAYKKVFPKCELDPIHRSRTDMRFTNGSKIRLGGIVNGWPGTGGEIIVIDDYFSSQEQALSEIERNSVYREIQGTLFNRIHPGGGIIVTATRWHVDDPIGRLIKDFPGVWTLIEFPAIAKKDEKFRKQGEALHPERWSLEQLNILRRDSGERAFASLYQCSPYLETGNFFSKNDIKYYTSLPPGLSFILGADYATSDSTSADNSAIIPAGLDANSTLYIAPDYIHEKLNPKDAVRKTVRSAKKYKTNILCHEKGVIANVMRPIFRDVYEEENYYLVTERYTRRAGKALYAMNVKARMESGKILFPLDKKEEIDRLLLSFDPKSDGDDDFVDALASVCIAVDRAVIPIPLPELPKVEERLSNDWRISDEAKRLLSERDKSRDTDDTSAYGW